MAQADDTDWRRAEREYADPLPEECTIPELFEASAERHVDAPAQQYKGGVYDRSLVSADVLPAAPDGDYTTLSYGEMRAVVRNLAAGFRDLGLGADDRVAIYANTRMEWAHSDLALLAAGCVVTTVYTESNAEQLRYLLDDPDADAVVVENEQYLHTLLKTEDDLDLERIVVVDDTVTEHDRSDVHTLAEVHDRGASVYDHDSYRAWLDAREPSDLASLIYTSGTTGDPKGVRLTHGNFRANVNQVHRRLCARPDKPAGLPVLGAGTTTISFLPLAHVFERLSGHFSMFAIGATVAYAEHPDTLPEDLRLVEPDTGASVPRVYERVHERIRAQASESPLKKRLFRWAAGVARDYAVADAGPVLRLKHAIADRLVYSTVRERLGGVEFMISGGGSLSPDLARLFMGMGVTIIEGYGLTETAPVLTVNPPEDIRPGTLGYPVVGVDHRLDESVVDPATVDADGPVGELLVRGPNVTEGYWEKPAETDAAFTDGWFRTGDIVEETADGYLRFHERIKQLLVLSTGKNVAPGPIEDRFATDERVEQVMLVGDDRKFITALVVPNVQRLEEWADRAGVDLPDEPEDRCEHPRVREWIAETVDRINADLGKTESIKQFTLVPEEWTPENDMLTPSMKKKRRAIVAANRDRIERMYRRAKPAE